jgi:hypothetical protein
MKRSRREVSSEPIEDYEETPEKYFVYTHVDGSVHFKRYSDQRDIDEMVASDLVAKVMRVTREQWLNYNRPMTPEEKASCILAEKQFDPRTLPGGIIGRLK